MDPATGGGSGTPGRVYKTPIRSLNYIINSSHPTRFLYSTTYFIPAESTSTAFSTPQRYQHEAHNHCPHHGHSGHCRRTSRTNLSRALFTRASEPSRLRRTYHDFGLLYPGLLHQRTVQLSYTWGFLFRGVRMPLERSL